MPRITKRQERGRGLLEYQRRLAQGQQDAAMAKAVTIASKAALTQKACEVPPPVIADADALVCGATTHVGDLVLTCNVDEEHDIHMASYNGGHFTWR